MLQTNNEKQNSVNSNKIILDANHSMHTPAIRDGTAFHFSFFGVINAGSLSNGKKKKRFITTNEKDRNKMKL